MNVPLYVTGHGPTSTLGIRPVDNVPPQTVTEASAKSDARFSHPLGNLEGALRMAGVGITVSASA